jgi:iron complex transport system substrate-binding protein
MKPRQPNNRSNPLRRALSALALCAALLLSACTPEPAPPGPAVSSPQAQAGPTQVFLPLQSAAEATAAQAGAPTGQDATAEPGGPAATGEPTAGPGAAALTLTDGLGRTVSLPAPARQVVSLAPSNTEVLYAIGAWEQLVGRDEFSDYPPQAGEIANIGGGFGDLDLETIVSLEPDLVLASGLSPADQVQALEDLGLTVYVLPNPTDLEGMYANLRTAARLTGHEAETEALVEDLQARVAAVEEKLAGVQERPLVFYELDSTEPNAPWTSGPGTFIDTLIDMSGGRNLGAVLEGEWAQISLEVLVAEDPDVIVLGDYTLGGVTPEDVAAREGWQGIAAVQNGRVYPFDDDLVSRPGPRLVDGLEQMAQLLHPELFE